MNAVVFLTCLLVAGTEGSEHTHEQAAQAVGAVEDPNDPAYLIGKELRCPVCQGMPSPTRRLKWRRT